MPNQRHFQCTVRKCELLNVYAVYFSVCFCFSEDTAFYNISTSSSPCLAALITGFIKTSLFLGRYFNMHCRKNLMKELLFLIAYALLGFCMHPIIGLSNPVRGVAGGSLFV